MVAWLNRLPTVLAVALLVAASPAIAQKTPAARQLSTPAAPDAPPAATPPASNPPAAKPDPKPAPAGDLVDATDPARLAAVLKGFGIARVEANSNSGNPQIDGRAEGKPYKLFFYGCTEKANCKSVQFWAYWDDDAPLEALNAWNRDTRYGKVYLDEDQDVVLEFDVNMVFGATEKTFEDNADIWVSLLGRVEKDVFGR